MEMPEIGGKKSSMRSHKKRNNINEVTVLLSVYRNMQRGLQNPIHKNVHQKADFAELD